MARTWRPRSVFICPRCYVWRVRVMAPWCKNGHVPLRCEKIEASSPRMSERMRRNLEKANA